MQTPPRSPWKPFACALVLVLVPAAIWMYFAEPTEPAPSEIPVAKSEAPRIFGSEQCSECHFEEYEDYLTSNHARTFWKTSDFPFEDQFAGKAFRDPDRQSVYRYFAGPGGLEASVDGFLGGARFPLQFALGSGEHATTLLTLTPDSFGEIVGVEHRVSYFGGPEKLGLTPGHLGTPIEQNVDQFGKLIRGEHLTRCIACHTTSARIVGEKIEDLIPHVGCENCHQNAEPHVQQMEAGKTPTAHAGFSGKPWRTADQIEICAECHRGADDLEPSEIRRDNWKIVRFQPVGLTQSKCFLHSKNPLRCTTCHDPHQHASKRTIPEYEAQCIACHQPETDDAVCSVSTESGCIDCHMPQIEIHPTIHFRDHWIRVRNGDDPSPRKDEGK